MKGKKKILFALGILVAAAVYYYVTLPAINIHSSDTWVMGLFLLLVLAAGSTAVFMELSRRQPQIYEYLETVLPVLPLVFTLLPLQYMDIRQEGCMRC